jgi:hypothetical protein
MEDQGITVTTVKPPADFRCSQGSTGPSVIDVVEMQVHSFGLVHITRTSLAFRLYTFIPKCGLSDTPKRNYIVSRKAQFVSASQPPDLYSNIKPYRMVMDDLF